MLGGAPVSTPATAQSGHDADPGAVDRAIFGTDEIFAWAISGHGEGALRAQARQLAEHLEANSDLAAVDVGHSLASSRTAFARRAVVLGDSRQELLIGLAALAGDGLSGHVVEGAVSPDGGNVVFVFPGQGTEWPGMAVGLLDSSPVFAQRMRDCADALAEHVDWSLLDVVRGKPGAPGLDRIDVVQPALFAMMVSLAELWRACGVTPTAVVGHSQGEIAAACVAGGLTLEDATRVVALRSRAFVGLAGKGGMASVALPVEELEGRLGRWCGRIGVAAVNGPASVVVSGDRQALKEFVQACQIEDIRVRQIQGTYAGHSAEMEQMREELLDAFSAITPLPGDVPFFSTVTGGSLATTELNGEYWYRNLREPIQFEQTMRALLGEGRRRS